MIRMIFLGPPGCGKGTYSIRLSPMLGIPHISSGVLFREEIEKGTKLGREADKYIREGRLVPDEMTFNMVKKRLQQDDCKNGFILDGYPRNLRQAKLLDEFTDIDLVIELYLPEDVLVEKLAGRRICERCEDIYNIADINRKGIRLPPMLPKVMGKCDKCGGRLIQRKDDTSELIRERLRKQQVPYDLLDFYKEKGVWKKFNVTGPPEEMVPKLYDIIKATKG